MIALEDEAGCGGVLKDEKGVVFAFFSGLIVARGLEIAKIIAIKIVVELYIGLSWQIVDITESTDIDCDINQLVRVQFIVIH
ncbi:hypothetical protein Godav_024165 [Gossypium davidsonii]|uniref:RNase H type-1 domain-containing protein n=2 Tax=Gossypium TaxID=3633 RepID=A0A7J8SUZ2_GOSDV|nr:hypothetical protein [Gossypium davidsonii]MBA0673348.1 hypothetical protein [Gossypium klotzschianum]